MAYSTAGHMGHILILGENNVGFLRVHPALMVPRLLSGYYT